MNGSAARRGILVADVGRTTCRVQFTRDAGATAPTVEVVSGVSLADRDGVAAVLAIVERAASRDAVQLDGPPGAVVVGVTGAAQSTARVGDLADALQRRFGGARVVVASDVVTAHLGALGGEAGVVVIAGTGAVALGVGHDGGSRLVDGHGPLLGDAGGGTWIARRALGAALRHHDGRPGGSPVLATAAAARFGPLARLPGRIQGSGHPWRELAAFVPDVAVAAAEGDPTSRALFEDVVAELAASARAAAHAAAQPTPPGDTDAAGGDRDRSAVPVALVGGLAGLTDLVRDAFATVIDRPSGVRGAGGDPGLRFVAAVGDALAGARHLATTGSGVHHPLVHERPARSLGALTGDRPVAEQRSDDVVAGRPPDETTLDTLATEGRLPAAAALDQLDTRAQVALLADQDAVAAAAVADAGDAIAAAVDLAVPRLRRGGRLVELGAGTSGRLSLLDVAECGPTFGVGEDRVVAVMAGGTDAAHRAMEAGEDDAAAGVAALEDLDVGPRDVVIGTSASGRTPYVLAALQHAGDIGAATVAVVSNPGSPLAAVADVAIETLTGPEVIAGSTRMKAGTAQKLVLNAVSTLSMVQLGHTFGDLMVDVRATNDKLRRRAERTVAQATGASAAEVSEALTRADGHAKTAVVALLGDVDVDAARAALDEADGHVRVALAALGDTSGSASFGGTSSGGASSGGASSGGASSGGAS